MPDLQTPDSTPIWECSDSQIYDELHRRSTGFVISTRPRATRTVASETKVVYYGDLIGCECLIQAAKETIGRALAAEYGDGNS